MGVHLKDAVDGLMLEAALPTVKRVCSQALGVGSEVVRPSSSPHCCVCAWQAAVGSTRSSREEPWLSSFWGPGAGASVLHGCGTWWRVEKSLYCPTGGWGYTGPPQIPRTSHGDLALPKVLPFAPWTMFKIEGPRTLPCH